MTTQRFVDSLRRLIHTVRGADLDGVALDAHIGAVDQVSAAIEPYVVEGDRLQAGLTVEAVMDVLARTPDRRERLREVGMGGVFPYSPYVGALNPLAPPAQVESRPGEGGWDELGGEVVFADAFNGPPGSVHGGVVAGMFDELLGSVCVLNDAGGFTGTLTVRYLSPTPIGRTIRLRAWVDRVEGRKTFALATMYDGDTLLAEAGGVFISAEGFPGDG